MFRARTTFWIGQRLVREGDIIKPDDPIIAGRERLLDPVFPGGETASAAPGEKRTRTRKRATKRPAKKTTTKKTEAGTEAPPAPTAGDDEAGDSGDDSDS